MSKVFEDTASRYEFLLQIILQRHDLKVQSGAGTQYDIKNLQGRSVRLDILAVDTNNRTYNIEIQSSAIVVLVQNVQDITAALYRCQ
ncbi:MAG: hypothetical protein ACLT8I_16675 [Blautia faecis]